MTPTSPQTRRSGPPPQRAAHAITENTTDPSRLKRPHDGYQAPTAADRREAALLAELRSLGYGITVPCLICRHPLTAPRSLVSHIGPVCAARMAEAQ